MRWRWVSNVRLPNHGPSSSVHPYFVMPHIVKGYRHVTSYTDSVLSCFTLSNEVANIWSHGIGAMFFLFRVVQLLRHNWDWNAAQPISAQLLPYIVQEFGCAVGMLGSTAAHIFHSQSEWHHQALFIVDFFAVTFFALCTAVSHYAYVRPLNPDAGPLPTLSANEYLFVALLLHLVVFAVQCLNRFKLYVSPYRSRVMVLIYSAAYGFDFLPFVSRYWSRGQDLPSDGYHLTQLAWVVASALVLALTPEKFAPQRLYFLHGHFFMHIGLFMSILQQSVAVEMDMERWPLFGEHNQPSVSAILAVLGTYVVVGIGAGMLIERYAMDIEQMKADSQKQKEI